MTMSVLIDLPSVLFSAIGIGWLKLDELTNFDTACCNKSIRNLLLSELKQLPPIFNPIYSTFFFFPGTVSMYNWIHARSIKLHTYVCKNSHFNNGKLLFNLDCSLLESIHCCNFSMSDIVNSCPNLVDLTITHDDIPKIKPSVLSNLTKLYLISGTPKNYQKTIKSISTHCKNLESIGDYSDARCSVFKCIHVLLRSNINLTAVDGKGTNDTLKQILSFPKIEDIILCLDEDLDESIFYDILQRESGDFLAQISDYDDIRRFNYEVKNQQKSLELELEGIYPPSKVIDLLSHTKGLTSFAMDDCLNNDVVNAIIQYCHSTLTTLQIYMYLVDSNTFNALISQCKQLTDVSIHGEIANNLNKAFKTIISNLKSLTLSLCEECEEHIRVSSMQRIIDNCPNLTKLTATGVNELDISIDSIKTSLKNHKNMKEFAMDYEICQAKTFSYNGDEFDTKTDHLNGF